MQPSLPLRALGLEPTTPAENLQRPSGYVGTSLPERPRALASGKVAAASDGCKPPFVFLQCKLREIRFGWRSCAPAASFATARALGPSDTDVPTQIASRVEDPDRCRRRLWYRRSRCSSALRPGRRMHPIPDAPPIGPDQVRTVHVPATPSPFARALRRAAGGEAAWRWRRGSSAEHPLRPSRPQPRQSRSGARTRSARDQACRSRRWVPGRSKQNRRRPPSRSRQAMPARSRRAPRLPSPTRGHPNPGEVSNRSGGTRPERRSASDRGTSAAPASFRDRPAGTADTSSATHVPGDNSTSNFPRDRAPVPPNDPGGAVSAAFGSTSSLLLGGFVAALMGLMLRHAFRAPTRRAASPSASLTPAPFASLLERPG